MRGIHRSPVNSPHKGQWPGALMLSLIWAWTKGSENHPDAGDLRHHHTHYEITIMSFTAFRRYNQPFRVIHDKIEQLSCHTKFYNDHLVRVWMTATQYAHWMWWKKHQWNATKSVTPWMAQQWSEFAWNLYYVCLVCFCGQSLVDICAPLSIAFGLTYWHWGNHMIAQMPVK